MQGLCPRLPFPRPQRWSCDPAQLFHLGSHGSKWWSEELEATPSLFCCHPAPQRFSMGRLFLALFSLMCLHVFLDGTLGILVFLFHLVCSIHPIVVVVQSLICVRLFVTPWTAACQASLSFTISQSLLKLRSIESVMPSDHLILCRPLLLLPSIFPSIRVYSNELALRIRWPKYCSFSSSINPSNEYLELISFRMDWFDLFAVQGTLKSLLQYHSSKASVLRRSALTCIHDHWKNHSFDQMDICWQSNVSAF